MTIKNPDQEAIFNYLREAKTIAVVGLSGNPERTSYQVAAFLQENGFKIIPVNPTLAGEKVLGETVYASLEAVPVAIDIVDIFRRSEFLPEIADNFLAVDAKVFWAQLGIENQEAFDKLQAAGKNAVVMDRCTKIELKKLLADEKF